MTYICLADSNQYLVFIGMYAMPAIVKNKNQFIAIGMQVKYFED